MANFRTHITVAAFAGGIVAAAGWQGGLWSLAEGVPLASLTTFGGILPDIDSDNSRAIRILFTLFAVLATMACVLLLQDRLLAGPLMMAGGATYLGVRYVASAIFKRFTVHRGIWHSLLASLLCSLGVTAASLHVLGQSEEQAWWQGAALLFGAMIHLLLDELYSVDMVGARLKRSFGTAFKLFDYREPGNSLAMVAVIAAMTPWLPPVSVLVDIMHLQGPLSVFGAGLSRLMAGV